MDRNKLENFAGLALQALLSRPDVISVIQLKIREPESYPSHLEVVGKRAFQAALALSDEIGNFRLDSDNLDEILGICLESYGEEKFCESVQNLLNKTLLPPNTNKEFLVGLTEINSPDLDIAENIALSK